MPNSPSYFDMHTHSRHSHDSESRLSDMVAAAKERGLRGFAVSDHCDIEYFKTTDLKSLIRESLEEVEAVDRESDLCVLRGIEIGEAVWNRTLADEIVGGFPFDVVISSVHAVRFEPYTMPYSQIHFAKMGRETAEKYLDRYFDDMLQMIETCDFDVLAHMTCPLRYVNGKYHLGIDCRAYEHKIRAILERIIARRIALEINTSCVYDDSRYRELLPEAWIIQTYRDMGGYLVTTGSDAHVAANMANRFEPLHDLLRMLGFSHTYYYKNRRAIPCEIKGSKRLADKAQ